MALVPATLRRRLLSRANFGGGPLVNLLAFAFQPPAYLKRMSINRGILGTSMVWKVVAVAVYSPGTYKKFFGKNHESLGSWNVSTNSFVNVINVKPMTRKERKASGVTKKVARAAIVAAAVAAVSAKSPDAKIVVK